MSETEDTGTEPYKSKTIDGVEYIEKEAFHDVMIAAETIIQDHVYIMKRMEGRHADGRMAMAGNAYQRLLNTVMKWTAFKDSLMGMSIALEDLEPVEKEQSTTIIQAV